MISGRFKRAVVLLLSPPGGILLLLLFCSFAHGELPSEPLGPCSRKTGLVISEILYNPRETTNNLSLEFLELYNSNPYPEDISGYHLQGMFNFIFPNDSVIAPKGFFVVGYSRDDLNSVYGNIEEVFVASSSSSLPGGLAALADAEGSVLLNVPVPDFNRNPKLIGADKPGHSIVLARPSYGEHDVRAWDLSSVIG